MLFTTLMRGNQAPVNITFQTKPRKTWAHWLMAA